MMHKRSMLVAMLALSGCASQSPERIAKTTIDDALAIVSAGEHAAAIFIANEERKNDLTKERDPAGFLSRSNSIAARRAEFVAVVDQFRGAYTNALPAYLAARGLTTNGVNAAALSQFSAAFAVSVANAEAVFQLTNAPISP